MRTIKHLIIHCSATRIQQDYSPEQMNRDHRARGFRSAGYHYYIRKDGQVIPLRQEEELGAHCLGYNRQSIGICYEGGLSSEGKAMDSRSSAQKKALLQLLKDLKHRYPLSQIVGHRDLSPDQNYDGIISPSEWIKQCPCFDAKKEYENISESNE